MIIDLIVIGIILLFTIIGYNRGLIKVAVKILSFFIAIILAFTLCTPITNMIIKNTTIDERIENAIVQKILPEGAKENQKVVLEQGLSNLLNVDKEATVKTVANEFSTKIIKAAALLLIFIATKIILLIVAFLTDAIAKLPVINQFNKLGGTIYGFLKGVFVVFVIFAIIFIASPIIDVSVVDKINSSVIGSFMYNNTLHLKIIF